MRQTVTQTDRQANENMGGQGQTCIWTNEQPDKADKGTDTNALTLHALQQQAHLTSSC